MFNNKKGNIMRHPYATLAIIGLATAGVLTIGEKIKCFCMGKTRSISNMMSNMKSGSHMMDQD